MGFSNAPEIITVSDLATLTARDSVALGDPVGVIYKLQSTGALYDIVTASPPTNTLRALSSTTAISSDWGFLAVASDGDPLSPGKYLSDTSGGPFAMTLDYQTSKEYLVIAPDDAATNALTLGAATDTFHFVSNGVAGSAAGPFNLDVPGQEVRLIATLTPDEYQLVVTAGASGSESVVVQATQVGDFAATAGSDGQIHEWPVDVSGSPAASELVVTAPAAPSPGDRFAVSDVALACDTNRTIKIDFPTQNLMKLPAPEYAVINSAGARLLFTFIDATNGWLVASNVNN